MRVIEGFQVSGTGAEGLGSQSLGFGSLWRIACGKF